MCWEGQKTREWGLTPSGQFLIWTDGRDVAHRTLERSPPGSHDRPGGKRCCFNRRKSANPHGKQRMRGGGHAKGSEGGVKNLEPKKRGASNDRKPNKQIKTENDPKRKVGEKIMSEITRERGFPNRPASSFNFEENMKNCCLNERLRAKTLNPLLGLLVCVENAGRLEESGDGGKSIGVGRGKVCRW